MLPVHRSGCKGEITSFLPRVQGKAVEKKVSDVGYRKVKNCHEDRLYGVASTLSPTYPHEGA